MSQNLFVTFFILFRLSIYAQSFVGLNTDNYSGLHGVIINPANVSDSRTKIEVNLLGGNGLLSNDYTSVGFSNLLAGEDIDFDNKDVDATSKNNGLLDVDILGPSAMFEIGRNYSMAVTSRARSFINVNNFSGDAIQLFGSGINENTPVRINDFKASSTAHFWAEYGATFGRVVSKGGPHFLKIGITAKLLVGYGFTNTNFIRGVGLDYNPETPNANSANGQLALNGLASYSFSENLDLDRDNEIIENGDDYRIKSQSKGIGFDLGLVYEYRTDETESSQKNKNKYLYKIGFSLVDLGGLKYKRSPATIYNLDGAILDQETLNRRSFQEVESLLITSRTGGLKNIKLPSSMHLNLDWNTYKNLYLNLSAGLSLIKNTTSEANRKENSVVLIPRLETKFLSLYLPVGIRQFSGFNMGAGFRLGPLYAGSGSIFSNVISKKSKTIDFYAGLKIPIFYSKDKIAVTEADKDGDGVIDKVDKCPDVPGPVSNSGCPKRTLVDTDKDGIPDARDECPDKFGYKEFAGCPKIKKLVPYTKEAIELEDTLEDYTTVISFKSGKTSFTEETYDALKSILVIIKKYPNANFDINGYTDSIGYERANQILSEKRAGVVKAYLVKKGVDPSRLRAQGFGEVDPKATNLYAAGRKINRRVEIKVAKW